MPSASGLFAFTFTFHKCPIHSGAHTRLNPRGWTPSPGGRDPHRKEGPEVQVQARESTPIQCRSAAALNGRKLARISTVDTLVAAYYEASQSLVEAARRGASGEGPVGLGSCNVVFRLCPSGWFSAGGAHQHLRAVLALVAIVWKEHGEHVPTRSETNEREDVEHRIVVRRWKCHCCVTEASAVLPMRQEPKRTGQVQCTKLVWTTR